MEGLVFRRMEQKYILNETQRQALEALLDQRMEPDKFARSSIRNIYYDTPDYRLIRRSLEKPSVYKEKLRLRSYGDIAAGGDVFLEMKKKYKGVVYKRRVAIGESQAERYMADVAEKLDAGQIGREIDYFKTFYRQLRPAMYLSYDRRSWRGEDSLRITLDWNVCYRTQNLSLSAPPGGEQLLEPGQYLLEVKTATAIPLWLTAFLSQQKIFKQSFSKYGTAYLRLLEANKIESGGFRYA